MCDARRSSPRMRVLLLTMLVLTATVVLPALAQPDQPDVCDPDYESTECPTGGTRGHVCGIVGWEFCNWEI